MSLESLNKRLEYYGGNQEQRIINDKLRSLKKSLLYSYQAGTAVFSDGREFRCLINPDKNKPAYDNKILSIPFKDICLNAKKIGKTFQGQIETGAKPGEVFLWKETNTYWLIYLQYLEEKAYFRAELRRCDEQVKIGDNLYWAYIRGPVETSIQWSQKGGVEWNSLNYSLVMYITADNNTNKYFKRFKTIKVFDPKEETWKTWQIAGVDHYYGDGIIQVFLDEYFENSIQDAVKEQKQKDLKPEDCDEYEARIIGPTEVIQYSIVKYFIQNAFGGHWYLKRKDEEIDLKNNQDQITLNIGETSEDFILIYRIQNEEDIALNIKVKPL